MLGMTQKAVRHRIARGELPYRRWGKRVLCPTRDIEAFLQDLPGCDVKKAVAAAEERRG